MKTSIKSPPRTAAALFAALGLVASMTTTARAANLVTFSPALAEADIVEDATGNGFTTTSTFDANLASFGSGSIGLTRSSSLSAVVATNTFAINGCDSAQIAGVPAVSDAIFNTAIVAGDYISFTIQAATGKGLNLNGGSVTVNIVSKSGRNAPRGFGLLTSVGGFADATAKVAVTGFTGANFGISNGIGNNTSVGAGSFTYSFVGSQYDNLTGPVEFRIYMSNHNSNRLNIQFGDITLDGSVTDSAIPEPSTYAMLDRFEKPDGVGP